MSDETVLVAYDPTDPRAVAAAARIAAVNASDTVGYPLPPSAIGPQLTLLEIWRPLRYIGSRGPRVFWRQCRVLGMSETGKPIWDSPTEWHVMDREFARKALAMPGGFFTFDWYPGNTFCVRRFNAPIEGDWAQARALRSLATGSPEAPLP